MEPESQPLPISPSEMQKHSDSQTSQLIRQWLFRFGVEHKEDVAPRLPLWLEAFGGMNPETLERLFRKALKTCKFFPKVSDILGPLDVVKQAATDEAAERAWEKVLELRRIHWCPDMPGGFTRGMPKLSERIRQACRAAGVFRDYESADQLTVWGKKRFIESFLAWDESELGKNLLPDGEVKDILTGYANLKSLPWTQAKTAPTLPAEERLRIADELAAAARQVLQSQKPKESYKVEMSDDRRKALRRQAELIKSKYPMSDAPPELRRYLLEPAPPIPQRAEDLAS